MTLRIKILWLVFICSNTLTQAQTVTANMITALPGDNFIYDGQTTPHYGIYWTEDSWGPGAYTAWLSGYSGIKFFTREIKQLSINSSVVESSLPLVVNTYPAGNSIQFKNNGTNVGIIGSDASIFGSNDASFGVYAYGNNNLEFSTNNTRRMTITGIGNIGIGTTTPNEKFEVNGKIRSREVKVEVANWPDYVFDSSYNLPSLQQLGAFVRANKHLPAMPSAKEVQKDGIDLGSNQAILLRKIEELTLHLIDMDTTIKELKKENQEIKNKLIELESL
ncbi:MAG: hypothetical protein QM727_00720 [Niabella sp.]